MDIKPTLEKIEKISGKDAGDFGGFHGLIDHLKANYQNELGAEIMTLEKYTTSENASVYVGTYAKYNNGSIAGAWVDLTRFTNEEDFLEYCRELHKDEEDPELMFQDFENFPEQYYGESGLNPDIFDFLSLDDDDKMMIEAFRDCFGSDGTIDQARDAYFGQYESDVDFAEELISSTGELDSIPENLRYYFDFEKYARDLMFDFSESNGFYFNNNW
jgi:antirestriction protein